jgi:hypothetical protein
MNNPGRIFEHLEIMRLSVSNILNDDIIWVSFFLLNLRSQFVILNQYFHIVVAWILKEKYRLGTSLNNRTCSEAEAGGHQDRRIKGRSRYSPCFKSSDGL